jgi:2-dehydropantoate 2-reductase
LHIVVFGAGGVGGYFGGRLANSGENVTFIARGQHLRAMLAGGLQVDSICGNFTIQPVTATDDPVNAKAVDVILVCVKTWQIAEASKALIPIIGPETFVVPLENGVQASSQLAEILGTDCILGGLCRIASRIIAPGHIQHSGIEPFIAFGELDNRLSVRSQHLLQCVDHAGVKAEIPTDIKVAIWQKYLFISTISGIGAITRAPVGLFRSIPETRQMLEGALNECYSIALAQGILLPPESVPNTLAYIDSLPPETIPSMQRDIMAGRPSELEAQNGAIVNMGLIYDIPTPVHTFIYHSLLPQENLARGQEH